MPVSVDVLERLTRELGVRDWGGYDLDWYECLSLLDHLGVDGAPFNVSAEKDVLKGLLTRVKELPSTPNAARDILQEALNLDEASNLEITNKAKEAFHDKRVCEEDGWILTETDDPETALIGEYVLVDGIVGKICYYQPEHMVWKIELEPRNPINFQDIDEGDFPSVGISRSKASETGFVILRKPLGRRKKKRKGVDAEDAFLQERKKTCNSTSGVPPDGLVLVRPSSTFEHPWPARVISAPEVDEFKERKWLPNTFPKSVLDIAVVLLFPPNSTENFRVRVAQDFEVFPLSMSTGTLGSEVDSEVSARYEQGLSVARVLAALAKEEDVSKRLEYPKSKADVQLNGAHLQVYRYPPHIFTIDWSAVALHAPKAGGTKDEISMTQFAATGPRGLRDEDPTSHVAIATSRTPTIEKSRPARPTAKQDPTIGFQSKTSKHMKLHDGQRPAEEKEKPRYQTHELAKPTEETDSDSDDSLLPDDGVDHTAENRMRSSPTTDETSVPSSHTGPNSELASVARRNGGLDESMPVPPPPPTKASKPERGTGLAPAAAECKLHGGMPPPPPPPKQAEAKPLRSGASKSTASSERQPALASSTTDALATGRRTGEGAPQEHPLLARGQKQFSDHLQQCPTTALQALSDCPSQLASVPTTAPFVGPRAPQCETRSDPAESGDKRNSARNHTAAATEATMSDSATSQDRTFRQGNMNAQDRQRTIEELTRQWNLLLEHEKTAKLEAMKMFHFAAERKATQEQLAIALNHVKACLHKIDCMKDALGDRVIQCLELNDFDLARDITKHFGLSAACRAQLTNLAYRAIENGNSTLPVLAANLLQTMS